MTKIDHDTYEVSSYWYPYLLKSFELRKEDINTDLHKISMERGDLVSFNGSVSRVVRR